MYDFLVEEYIQNKWQPCKILGGQQTIYQALDIWSKKCNALGLCIHDYRIRRLKTKEEVSRYWKLLNDKRI